MRGHLIHTLLFISYYLLLVGSACRPESKGQSAFTIPPDSAALTQIVDSGGFLGQDGLDYEPLNTGTYDQLPPELSALLNQNSPGWSLPYISRKHLKKTDRNHTGPYYLQADFNQDNTLDFAVQYFYQDTIYIKAFVQKPGGKLQQYHLDKFLFKKLAEKEESKLFLSLLPKGIEIITSSDPDKSDSEKIVLPQNAIGVINQPNSYLFYFEGQGFKRLNWQVEKEL